MSVCGRDFRNTLRGACVEHSDCLEYEWLPDIGYNCIYCGCLPVHHKRIDENNSAVIVDRDNVSRSEPEIAGPSNEVELPPPNNSPSTLSGVERNNNFSPPRNHTCIQCQQQVTLEFLIPDIFRPNLMKSINSGLIDYKEQSEIIRTVASNMIQHEKTNKDQVTEVAVALVQKIPSLKGVFGIEYMGVEKSLKDCIKRQKSKKKKNSNSQNSDLDWQKEQREIMEREVRKGKDRSKDILRRTLQQTRECRSKENKKLTAGEMLQKYPAFKVPEMIIWEFSDSYNLPLSALRKNWIEALPKILTLLPSTSRIDVNGQTVHVLLTLPKLFPIRNKENRKDLLIIHKPGTSLDNLTPQKNEPPFLSAVGNADDDKLKLFGYVDGIAMFNNEPMEALIEMMAIYWVFNIQFHSTQKHPLLFISACLFRKDSSRLLGQTLAKALSVTKLLSTARIS